jgi:hypothetical protein
MWIVLISAHLHPYITVGVQKWTAGWIPLQSRKILESFVAHGPLLTLCFILYFVIRYEYTEKEEKYGALSYLPPIVQRTLSAKINCALKVISRTFFQSELKLTNTFALVFTIKYVCAKFSRFTAYRYLRL